MLSESLPRPGTKQAYVSLSMFPGGFITLPEKSFVSPSTDDTKRTVPSMAFLVSHPGFAGKTSEVQKSIRMMFDLGLRSSATDYSEKQQLHLENRVPYALGPSIAEQLARGDLSSSSDIDVVLLSHVHYDHNGDPQHFPSSEFIVGAGSCDVLKNGLTGSGSHQHFQADLLPANRTRELPLANDSDAKFRLSVHDSVIESRWSPLGPFPAAMDIFGDGSVYVVDSPGHLPGHINLLCRVGPLSWVYLGGDSCHDTRLLSGEKEISTWQDDKGTIMCIHLDRSAAKETLKRISRLGALQDCKVQIIMAHDWEWYEKHKDRCFPEQLVF